MKDTTTKTKVSLVKCETYEQKSVFEAVKQAVDLIGGITKFVKPGEKILLKPNLLAARLPERAITTHPEVARAVIKLVRQAGAEPLLGDSPGGAIQGVERVWIETGMKAVCEEENVKLVNFESSGTVEKEINHPLIKNVRISKAVLEADGIINLPKLKTHGLLIYTGAIKNLYGTIPGMRKAEYHKIAPHPEDFSHLLDEIYLLVKNKIRFNLIDGIMGMEGNGPSSGVLRKINLITASEDAVSLDIAITILLGLKPKKLETLRYLKNNTSSLEWHNAFELTGNKASDFDFTNFKFPSNWHINLVPKWFVSILGSHLWIKPVINESRCKNCKICAKSCPVKAIDNAIGEQKPFVRLKECISCLCCHELCPYDSIDLKKSWLLSLLSRKK